MLGFPFITLASFIICKLVSLVLLRNSLVFFTNPMITMANVISADWTFSMFLVNYELFLADSLIFDWYFLYFHKG